MCVIQTKLIVCVIPTSLVGATVHMVCRNSERGEKAKQDIVSESGNDVSSLPPAVLKAEPPILGGSAFCMRRSSSRHWDGFLWIGMGRHWDGSPWTWDWKDERHEFSVYLWHNVCREMEFTLRDFDNQFRATCPS